MADDLHQLRERARVASAQGRADEAANLLVAALAHTHVTEADWQSVLQPLAAVLERRGDARSALTVRWYSAVGDPHAGPKLGPLLAAVPPVDRARSLALLGDFPGAAREMEDAGKVAAAAIYREKAGDFRGARALWSRLAQVAGTGADAYEVALVHFNLARMAKACDDARQAKEASVAAMRLLEEAADHYESVGQRERAFDCFQVLVQIGRASGMFEDVLEGYVNCIRILREDHLKYFALQYFEDALKAARERGELSAAAQLAREAAEYARTLGLGSASAYYVLLGADLYRELAGQHRARGAPAEIAENALLASILAYGELGAYRRIGGLYEELAALELEPARRAHYARAAKRYATVRDEAVDAAPLPSHLRQDSAFPEVWHVDVLEWEQQGSAAEAAADVLLDRKWSDQIRRKALVARLTAFAVEGEREGAPGAAQASVRLAEQLAQLQLYAVLSPLERLFARPEPKVKVAVLAALQQLFFKRSFVTVRAALRERDASVLQQAARCIEALYFQHAFDPLSRIVRESQQEPARLAALKALARVDTVESAELLVGVLEHGAPSERSAVREGLRRSRGTRFVEAARAALPGASRELSAVLQEILRERGAAA